VAKYELMHSVRSHIGADDDAFNAIRQREDEDGIRGIILQRNVVPTAATALKTNIASLAPLVLPFTELVSPIVSPMLARGTWHSSDSTSLNWSDRCCSGQSPVAMESLLMSWQLHTKL